MTFSNYLSLRNRLRANWPRGHPPWSRSGCEGEMCETKKGMTSLGLDNAIRLPWRDIKGKHLKLTPVGPTGFRASSACLSRTL
jgi:hypothetical protein